MNVENLFISHHACSHLSLQAVDSVSLDFTEEAEASRHTLTPLKQQNYKKAIKHFHLYSLFTVTL